MKKMILTLIGITLLCSSCGGKRNAGQSKTAPEAAYHKISSEEARDMMESSESYTLVDVRTEEEYKEQRINGAILIPDYEISERAETELPDKDAVILVYCRSGRRSADAAKELVDMGYANVYDFGGILDWPYDIIRD